MKHRTGNGTWRRQNLYCMVHLPYFWIWKIGIGRIAKVRANSISNEVPGRMYVVAVVDIVFAYQIEQAVLSATRWAKVPLGGLTEVRFIIPGVLFPLLILVLHVLKNTFWLGLVVGLAYLGANFA